MHLVSPDVQHECVLAFFFPSFFLSFFVFVVCLTRHFFFFFFRFPDAGAAQREHYQSDLHRYNLKRRVANLPCVTQSEYEARVAAKQAQSAPAAEVTLKCAPCRKSFKSQAQLDSHLASKKHAASLKAAAARPEQRPSGANDDVDNATSTLSTAAADAEHTIALDDGASSLSLAQLKSMDLSALSEEQLLDLKIQTGVKLEPTDCLFCSQRRFATSAACIEHMASVHSFFIPDLAYITDIDAFLQFLGQKVGIGNACVNCNKTFLSLEAVRNHMHSTSHSKLPLGAEASEELGDFYDFANVAAEADADGAAESSERALALANDVVPQRKVVDADAYFVRFDDGRVIGHRALVTFYKQNVLLSNPSEAALLRAKVSSAYRDIAVASGPLWHGPAKLDKAARIAKHQEYSTKFNETLRVEVAKEKLFAPSSSARRYVRT